MAAELVGGAFLSSFLQVAFDRLARSDIWDYFRRRKLNETLLKRLNIMLLSINAVVDDAEQKQIANRYVKAWLDEVKDAAYEADDLLDEIDTQVSTCKLEAESDQTRTSKVWDFFNVSGSSFHKEIESRMQQVLDNLEYLASKIDILGLNKASGSGVGSGRQVSQKLPTSSLVNDTVIYGRDDDNETIFNWLMCDQENHKPLSVISIVGMGGMGKTTLAQHLYNDPRTQSKFDIKAWVCVSDEFDVIKITTAILEATNDSRDINMLQLKLKEKLTGKKFLLVLDDVWNENRMQWEALQTPFNYGAPGSKILVTTRSKKVALTMLSNKIHDLEQLQEEYCWQLFTKHAFRDDNPHQINHEFKEIGTKIVAKCKGLPLALKTIGVLLYTKSSVLEWERILTSEIWDLPEEDSTIIPALRLSYQQLPSHLKRCFAYCSLFPKDYEFAKEHLCLLWMAENFIQCPQQNISMEEVGEQYFNDLLSRSFFQQIRVKDKCYFIMHDLLNDLAKYVSGDFCFRLEDKEAQNISKMTRHFSFIKAWARLESFNRFEGLNDVKRFRTFLPIDRNSKDVSYWMSSNLIHELFSKFKYLRVISLSGYSNITVLPDTIGNLKHLRYIDLSRTSIKKLPDSICLLYNLQVLKLNNCQFLEELPMYLHKLTNLCYLDFHGTKVRKTPMHFGNLKNLQVLSLFYVGKDRETNIQQLGELNLHGALTISGLQNIENPLDALAANFKNKVHLTGLELEWSVNHDESEKEREVLEKLEPSQRLINLSIYNYGGTRFPDWFGDNSLSKLTHLKLRNCKNCMLLPPLGLLSSLKELSIIGLDGIVVIGDEFYGSSSSSFASLEALDFMDMGEWEEWDKIVTSAFPRLKRLSIVNCPKLKGQLPLPEQLPCLMEIKISNCQQLVASAPCAPPTLKSLTIGGSFMEGSFLESIGETISETSLETLIIFDCPNMNIPMRHSHNFLVKLSIDSSCDSLRTFSLDFFPKLCWLKLWNCRNLEMISQEHEHNLDTLTIKECPNFVSFPIGGLSAPRLREFVIKKMENLKSLPECMHNLLPSLANLWIVDCPQLESFSDGGLPSNIKYLQLSNCSKLIPSLKWALGTNSSLAILFVERVEVESFPDQGLLPHSLTSLTIKMCPNLKKLDYNGLCHLSSLQRLYLKDCSSLPCLPEEGLPKSISTLVITGNCSSLIKSCQKPEGKDWGKIAHIKSVYIGNDILT